jgi:hypothetical protein
MSRILVVEEVHLEVRPRKPEWLASGLTELETDSQGSMVSCESDVLLDQVLWSDRAGVSVSTFISTSSTAN